ncbi:hypothetical protein GJ744_010805 [Endocarpon pusillum]|uniref:Transferase caf17, mitochondrial n=1 Tax=Endocarpon pusillum TaxID=364733 RepID=A0A8H7AHS1_9EURO|nr:hypothetical protein GJ744_010805 [Endocarpon pusillum]
MYLALQRNRKVYCSSRWLPLTVTRYCFRWRSLPSAKSHDQFPPLAQSQLRTLICAPNPSFIQDKEKRYRDTNSSRSDTIYALSTAPGRAAIAVIRISGPGCLQVYRRLCPDRPLPRARTATVRRLYDPAALESAHPVIDPAALVLYFPRPNTVTGEDVLELHTHGGPAIVKAVLNAISSNAGASSKDSVVHAVRYADLGEFTKRAFYNHRLDLPQIEALGDALSAETELQRRLAVNGTGNELGERYEKWRNLLLYARGELEALIDFSEDQHLDESPRQLIPSVSKQITGLERQISLHIQNASKGELLRSGISIALLGAPNAGKSSLLNRIVGREAAIVSAQAGTTRDIVDVSVDIGGWLCRFGDMAGLRRASWPSNSHNSANPIGAIEKEGMRRAKARALTSDLVVVMLSLEVTIDIRIATLHIDEELLEAARECERLGKAMIVIINKIDKLQPALAPETERKLYEEVSTMFPSVSRDLIFLISCLESSSPSNAIKDPGNIQGLLGGLQSYFASLTTPSGPNDQNFDKSYWEQSLSVSHRQSEYLRQCLQHLDDFLCQTSSQYRFDNNEDLVSGPDIVAAAEHLRYAANCLAKITGKGEAGDVEDVLGVVFEKFCVGK